MHPSLIKKIVLIIVLAIVLALTFMAYLRPSFIVDLANRIVLCL
jgi:hypothetical protein